MAWSPRTGRGIKGIGRFGNHAWRVILATGVYKYTGKVAAAARAIADSEKTAWEHYIYIDQAQDEEEISEIIADGMRHGLAAQAWI